MKKLNQLKKKITSICLILATAFIMLLPSATVNAAAVKDSISFGDPSFNALTNVMKYSSCVGYGSTAYKSLVITFTSTCVNGEKIVLPTQSGFVNEDSISNDVTKVVNITDGATLPNIAAFIRKIEFQNCSASAQQIKFSVGKEEVHYMTLYSNDTGHFYQFVPYESTNINDTVTNGNGQSIAFGTWQYAYYQSLNMEYEGLQGYLCTITSAAEDAFLKKNSGEIGWLGATRMNHGDSATKNGITYYKSFTIPTSTSDMGIGYWYWSTGPEVLTNGGKFLSTPTGTMAQMATEKAAGNYNNWNKKDAAANTTTSTEPNNASGEYCATTLKIGKGFETSGASGSITTDSPYYIESGYSWNDVDNDRWAFHDGTVGVAKSVTYNGKTYSKTITDYTCTGFFVEFGTNTDGEPCYLSDTTFTGFVQGTSTNALTHNWQYAQNSTDKSIVNAYCITEDPKCSYYGSSTLHANTIDFQIFAPDVAASSSAYSAAYLSGDAAFKAGTGGTIGSYKYYKTTTAGATTGGTPLDSAPSDIGYYYVEVTATTNNTISGATNNSATAVAAFKIYDPNGATVSESLNNRMNSELQATSNITSSNDETKLNVILAAPTDDIALYKLATCTWNGSNLSDLTWVSTVSDWLTTGTGKTLYGDLAKTPSTLSSQSNSTWSSFFNDLLVNTNHIDLTKLTDLVTNASDQYQTHTTYYKDASGNLVTDETTDDVANTKYQETFDEIELGIYAVVTPGYAVTVATIYPQETGPGVTYYIQNEYTVYLKEVQATIDKTINGLKEDTVGIGETEHFEVEFTLPTYKDAAFTYSSSDDLTSIGYSLSFEDIMASGYTIDSDSLKIYYYYTDEEDDISFQQKVLIYDNDSASTNTNKTIPTASPKKFFKSTTTDTAVTGNSTVHVLTSDDIGTEYADYTTDSSLVGAYAIPRSNVKIFDKVAITASTSASTNTTILINFDEPAVRQYIKDVKNADATKVIKGFVISYDATVNKNIKIASEDNKNTAYIHYEKSSIDKTLTEMHDTVYGYTYATSIVKIDGTASTDTSIKYLSGAKFKLYKEYASYIRTGSAGSYTYTYKGDVDMDETDPFIDTTNTDSDKVIAALQKDSSYYVYEMTATEAGTTNAYAIGSDLTSYNTNKNTNETALNDKLTLTSLANVSYSSGDVIVRVYKEVALEKIDSTITSMARDADLKLDGVITSVATAGGVQVDGLDVGSYILTEVAAPTGYNDLAEDVYFEINKLTLLEEQSTTSKTLQQFREMPKTMTYDATDPTTAELNAAADLELLVYNYKGLTLPSTGGMGTLIFTIIGLIIMVGAMVYIMAKRKQNSESFMS